MDNRKQQEPNASKKHTQNLYKTNAIFYIRYVMLRYVPKSINSVKSQYSCDLFPFYWVSDGVSPNGGLICDYFKTLTPLVEFQDLKQRPLCPKGKFWRLCLDLHA